MSDLLPIFLDDAARVAAIAMTADQRKKLLYTLRCIQRDTGLGILYTAEGEATGRIIVVPGDDAVPGMTIAFRVGDTQVRVVNILAGP